jgi:hypothetical protein
VIWDGSEGGSYGKQEKRKRGVGDKKNWFGKIIRRIGSTCGRKP